MARRTRGGNGALARWLEAIGGAAAAAVAAGVLLGWLRVLPGLPAFGLFAIGGLAALVTGLSGLLRLARGRRLGLGRGAALVAAIPFVASATAGFGKPAINDFTTDLADPPAFRHAAELPANRGRDLSYPPSFAPIQRKCCSDLRPLDLALPPARAFDRARRVAEGMPGWKVTDVAPAEGRIEAVATSSLFGFRDDVVVRVRPVGDHTARIDVRSKSRDGRGDLGANAERIRTYLEAVREIG